MNTADDVRLYRTGEVLRRSGLSRQVLYSWTAIGLLREAERTDTGRMLFDEDVFDHLGRIRRLQDRGLTLREIRDLFERERSAA